jgi:hypothetical protein
VVARLGRPVADDTEAARITAFIEDATALVMDYCQNDFAQHSNESFDLLIEGGQAEIPFRYFPGLTVSSVVTNDGTELVSGQDWQILGRTLFLRRGPVLGSVTLTASWGWPALPGAVRSVICSEVIRWIAVAPGTVIEKTGELEVQYAPTANNPGLSNAAQLGLKRYRKRMGTYTLHRTNVPNPVAEEIRWHSSPTP